MHESNSNKVASPGWSRLAHIVALSVTLGIASTDLAFAQGKPAQAPAAPAPAAPAPAKAPAPAPAKAPAPKAEAAGTSKAGSPAAGATATTAAGAATAPTTGEAAPAGPTDQQREAARTAFEAGMAAHGAGDYVTAAAEFKKAQEAIPSPFAEYWLADSLDKADPEQKNPKATVEAYELFVTNPGAKHVGPDKVDASVERIKTLRALLPATLMVVTSPVGATVTINGEKQTGITPLTVERPAGAYHIEATVEGYAPLAVDVNLEGGITLEQQMNLVKVAAPPPPPPPVEEKKRSMVPAYVTAGVAGAGLILGTVFGIMAIDAQSRYNENPSTELADEQERNALICDMAIGVAVTLGITSVVLFTAREDASTGKTKGALFASGSSKKQRGLTVAPYASTTGGGARARLTF